MSPSAPLGSSVLDMQNNRVNFPVGAGKWQKLSKASHVRFELLLVNFS